MANEREIARRLLELFGENGENWIRNAFARDEDGQCSSESSSAKSWCLAGAMSRLNIDFEAIRPLLPVGFSNFIIFNDESEWKTVKEWLDKIATEETHVG